MPPKNISVLAALESAVFNVAEIPGLGTRSRKVRRQSVSQ